MRNTRNLEGNNETDRRSNESVVRFARNIPLVRVRLRILWREGLFVSCSKSFSLSPPFSAQRVPILCRGMQCKTFRPRLTRNPTRLGACPSSCVISTLLMLPANALPQAQRIQAFDGWKDHIHDVRSLGMCVRTSGESRPFCSTVDPRVLPGLLNTHGSAANAFA